MFASDNPIMQDIGPKKPEYMSVEEQVELQKTVDKLLEENRKLKQEKQGLLSLGGRNPGRSTVQDPRRRKKKKKFDDGIEMEEMPASGLPGMKREGNGGGEEPSSSSGRNPLKSKSRSSRRNRTEGVKKEESKLEQKEMPSFVDRNDLI